MRDLARFREAVGEHRRAAGRTQRQLARSIGLHPDVLSHKLNGRDRAVLTAREVIGIVTTLAGWGALVTRADVQALLDLMQVPRHAIPAAAWSEPPLAALRGGQDTAADGEHGARRPGLALAALPAPATPLIGREHERAVVAATMSASRLVTLTGTGGVGKTRLALRVAGDLAGDFADGAAFADLALVHDPALFATAVADALGLAPASAEGAEELLRHTLRDRELLLVLDNLEHLIDETHLLARLLAAAPAVRMLATSRIALRLYGEHVVRVPPLQLPADRGGGAGVPDCEAVRLFTARARAVRPGFTADAGELDAVAGICAVLDGLPLAIELAAARIRLYEPGALLTLLQSRLTVLTGGSRDLPHRQQTLRATLDWSYALLTPDERRLFARLGVFAGPFDAAAAAAVDAEPDPATALEYLAGLADKSLLEVTAGMSPGFRMLQTVREYSLARLAETGELDEVGERHLVHYLAVAEHVRREMDGPRQAGLFDRIEAVYPDIRAALEFACQQAERHGACLNEGMRLAAAVGPFWQRRGSLAEGLLHLGRLLALDDAQQRPAPPPIRAPAVLEACVLSCFQGNYPQTVQLARHVIELCGPLGDHRRLSKAHRMLGEAVVVTGDGVTAEPHFRRQLAEASQADDLACQADAYNMLGQAARYRGEFRVAQCLFWQSLKLWRAAGDPNGVAASLSSLGEAVRDAGRPGAARRFFCAALRRHAVLGHSRDMAFELEGLAAVAALEHDGRTALVYLGAALALREQTGCPPLPADQAILDRILAPAVASLPARERDAALRQGQDQPLQVTISHALGTAPGTPLA